MPQLAQFVISAPRDGLRRECGPRPAARERVRVSAPRAVRYAAPRDRPIALEDLPCPGRGARRWRGVTALRRFRVRAVSGLRHPRQWLRPGALRIVRRRNARCIFVQRPGLLPFLHDPPHARDGNAPAGPRFASGSHAPVGAFASALGPIPPGA